MIALFSMAAQAAVVYKLPGNLPSGCSAASSTSYTCNNLSLDWNDSIVVVNANTTLAVSNTLSINGNDLNTASPASGFAITAKTVSGSNYLNLNGNLSASNNFTLGSNSNNITGNVSAGGTMRIGGRVSGTLTTSGALTTEWATTITGNVSARSISSGGGSTYGGSLTATGGDIVGGANDSVGTTVSASGALSTGSGTVIGGNVSAGSVVSGGGSTYGGNLTATAGGFVGGSSDKISGTLTVTGTVSTGWGTTVGGAVTARSIDSGGGSIYSGNLTATGGNIALGSSDQVTGSLTATGNISSGSANAISGNVTSSGGYVDLGSSSTSVGGSVAASGDVTIGSGSSVAGDVVSSGGGVVLRAASAKVGGNVAARDRVTLGSGTQVVGNVSSSRSDVVLNASGASVGKCVTVDASDTIRLGWSASVGGVCCDNAGTCGNACVDNQSGGAMPPLCTPSSTCPNYGPAGASLDTTLWNAQAVSGGYTPAVVDVGGQKRFRLTSNGKNQATMLQLKKWFPAAGNKIVVSFDYYVYGGLGADGIALVFSDAAVAPSAGAYGGSLGYAQKTGVSGFAGGWLAVGLDEYGNFPAASEGRQGYPSGWTAPAGANTAAGFAANSVAVRGSGSGTTGYALLANTGALSTPLWRNSNTSASWQNFRVTIDHSNSVNAYVSVERNTGNGYASVVPKFDAKAGKSGQAAVPANWLLSFTGATGDYANYHEIANVSICATYIIDPGGSEAAANFECLETGSLPAWSASARKPLYTKLVDTGFKFDVVALKADGSVESGYVAGSDQKSVTVELFDDSASSTPACSAYANPVATQSLSFAAGDAGRKTLAADFKLAAAYRKLRCRVSDKTVAATPVYGCSSDRFTVRPFGFSVTSPTANSDPSGSSASASSPAPTRAGTKFTLLAASLAPKYDGQPLIDPGKLAAHSGAVRKGDLAGSFAAADAATGTASGTAFVYPEVGYFRFAAQGVYDDAYASASGDAGNGDCTDDFSNTAVGGKYGCKFGNALATSYFGRFIPDHLAVTPAAPTPGCNTFTYFAQDGFTTPFTLTAQNAANETTQNYNGSFARLTLSDWSVFAFSASPALPAGATLAAGATAPSGAWVNGMATISARHQVGRPSDLAGETAVTLLAKPVDSDGVTPAAASAVQSASTPLRYGRMKLYNAYGSEKSDLRMPLQLHYWSGKSWVINSQDTCTTASLQPAAFAAYANGVASSVSEVTVAGGTGVGWLTLTKPSPAATGFVDVAANLGSSSNDQSCLTYAKKTTTPAGLPWLRSQNGSCATTYDRDPSARASFGIYSPEAKKTVHIREAY